MKKLLFALAFCFVSFSTNASTVLNLICDQQSFKSRHQTVSKDLGHTFADGERFFQLEFDNNSQKLETDMGVLVNNTIKIFENNNNILKITTAVDSINYFHTFTVNRFTGVVKVVRIHLEDEERTELYKYKCKSAKMQF